MDDRGMDGGAAPGTGRQLRGARAVGVFLVALLAVLAGWLYWTGVEEFRFYSDDAFISYRYSRNFTRGLGLVWNPGQIVEGYTSFLWIWVGVLAIELGFRPEATIELTVVAGALVLVLITAFSGRRRRLSNPLIVVPALLLASNRTFLAWSTGGLATQLFSLAVLGSALVFLHERRRSSAWPLLSSLGFALATLTRPEGVLFAFVAGVVLLVDVLRKKRRLASLVAWVVPYFAIVGAHVLWRHDYYGYWLPNTYYAKVSGRVRLDEGILYLRVFLLEYGLTWFLPLLLVPLTLRRRAEDFLFGGFLVVFTAYVLWVGGDWMEFRFLNVLLPYLYWLLVEAFGLLFALVGAGPMERLLQRRVGLEKFAPVSWVPWFSALFKALGGVGLMLLFVVTWRTSVRTQPEVKQAVGSRGGAISDVRTMRAYAGSRMAQGLELREWVDRGLLPEDLRIAVGGAGALPYFSDLYTVDILGWNDTTVAHGPITNPGRIGHEREASQEYLAERGVELIDVTNGLVRHGDPATFPREIEKQAYSGPLFCYEVEEGVYLLFGTTLDEERLEERLGQLERVF